MHGALQNAVKQHAAAVVGTLAKTTLGHVSSYDAHRYAVKVRLAPSNIETGWMPITAQQVGSGWGAYFAPALGDQCLVGFVEMYPDACYLIGFLPSDTALPPPVQAGEMVLQHASGTLLKLAQNGDVVLLAVGNLSIHATGNASLSAAAWSILGDVSVSGSVTASGDVVAGAISLDGHTHTSAAPGSPTSVPL